jgi:hypothetical protein
VMLPPVARGDALLGATPPPSAAHDVTAATIRAIVNRPRRPDLLDPRISVSSSIG